LERENREWKEKIENGKRKERKNELYASIRQQQHKPGPERAARLAGRQIETGCALAIIAFMCTTRGRDSQPFRREIMKIAPASVSLAFALECLRHLRTGLHARQPEIERMLRASSAKQPGFLPMQVVGSKEVRKHKEDVMKLTNAITLNTVKTAVTRAAAIALVAGAAFLATPAKANAQVAVGFRAGHVRVGVGIPGPVYAVPRPYYPAPRYVAPAPGYGFYGPRVVYERRFGWHDRRFYR
jgi:hypothetical protein